MRELVCNICGSSDISLLNTRYGYMYKCNSCGATVGCHSNSKSHKPKGIFADKEMRELRISRHKLFDNDKDGFPRWFGVADRNSLYEKLAREMGIGRGACHFAKMDKPTLRKAISVMEEWK